MNINIILFTNRGGRVLSFKFNPLRTGLLVGTGVALLYVLGLYGGLQLGRDGLNQWQKVAQEQQLQIDDARKSARTHLDALTLRLGRMQARMLQPSVARRMWRGWSRLNCPTFSRCWMS